MSFIKNFLSLNYYIGVLDGTRKFRVFIAILVLSLILTIHPSYLIFKHVYPVAKNIAERVTNFVEEVYPQELEVTIKSGQASTNVTEPYYISVNTKTLINLFSLKQDDVNTESKTRLLAIDTKGKADDFERYQALALLTENSLVYVNSGDIKIYSLREAGDITVNKQFIKDKINEYNKDNQIGKFINIGVIISPLFVFIGNYIVQLVSFLAMAVLVFLMAKIKQVPAGFKKCLAFTSLIAFVVSLIWNLVILIPFMYSYLAFAGTVQTMIIMALAYCGIYYYDNKKKTGGNNAHNP